MDLSCVFRTASLVASIIILYTNFSHHSVEAKNLNEEATWPCTDRSAIQWIRHPDDCSVYYICHYGQPLLMPECPYGQVWGIRARNCVPEQSRWNDCPVRKLTVKNETKNIQENLVAYDITKAPKNYPVTKAPTPKSLDVSVHSTRAINVPPPTTVSPKLQASVSTKRQTTTTLEPTVRNTTTSRPVKRTQQPAKRPQNDYGQDTPPKPTVVKEQGKNKKTQFPTVTSPYHPNPRNKYYTYPKHTKTKVIKKLKKISTSLPQPHKETKPTKPPFVKQLTTQPSVRTTTQKRYDTSLMPSTIKPRLRTFTIQYQKTTPKTKLVWSDSEQPKKPKKIYGTSTPPTSLRFHTRFVLRTTIKTPKLTSKPILEARPTQRLRPTVQTVRPTPTSRTTTTTTTRQPRRSTRPAIHIVSTVTPTQRTPSQATVPTTTMMLTTKMALQENKGGRVNVSTSPPSDWAIKPMQLRLPEGHPCRQRPGGLVGHPKQCHWYYNCTNAALENVGGHLFALEEECRYPQLFDTTTGRCREFINVQCQDRFEPVDPCEYQGLQCHTANCMPCHHRYGSCRSRENGIYPFHTQRWTPTFVTCYQQRNIAQDDCQAPTPIFSPDARDCVALSDVPKDKGGLRPDCSFRQDGFYPDEQGRCGIFFQCQNSSFVTYDECPLGTVFDPMTFRCQLLHRATPPCGEGQNPGCSDRSDGFHADPFGRCPYYFECRKSQFVRHLTCDYGSFDPRSQDCVIPTELIPRPCGLMPNPCEGKPSGFYPDSKNDCLHYIECSRGVLVTNSSCPQGLIFSAISGRCDRPENAPEPCGMALSCEGKADGRYSALTRGCSFYFECRGERFAGLKQCTMEEGGFFFNERTGRCDLPQNICPPCGYKWWGVLEKHVPSVRSACWTH